MGEDKCHMNVLFFFFFALFLCGAEKMSFVWTNRRVCLGDGGVFDCDLLSENGRSYKNTDTHSIKHPLQAMSTNSFVRF